MEMVISAQQGTSVSLQNTVTLPSELGYIVTIVRDALNLLGRRFHADGAKSAEVRLSMSFAVQRAVPTPKAMTAVLKEISEDPHAALPGQ